MKSPKRKLSRTLTAIVLSAVIALGSAVSASAADLSSVLIGLLTGSSDKVNITQMATQWLQDEINKPSLIDEIVENVKNEFNGTQTEDPSTVFKPTELDETERGYVAELFNTTVNELKKSNPSFYKSVTSGLSQETQKNLAEYSGTVGSLVRSVLEGDDMAAAVVGSLSNTGTGKDKKYNYGESSKDNISITGKDYVTSLTSDDVYDYTVTVYKSGAYLLHIDLPDVVGASANSGLAHAFDTTDKQNISLNLVNLAVLNVSQVYLRYVNNYVECQVNRDGEITRFTTHMGCTMCFETKDSDGNTVYSTKVPMLGIDLQEKGLIYENLIEYSGFDWTPRQLGDTDNNGKVNSADARAILRVAAKLESYEDADKIYYDVNNDGNVNSSDARLVLRASAKIEKLPDISTLIDTPIYEKSEQISERINDLIALVVQCQANKTTQTETTTVTNTAEEPTTNSTTDKINSATEIIGDIFNQIFK